jgi:predicted DNA-binding protein (UPF0251 family)
MLIVAVLVLGMPRAHAGGDDDSVRVRVMSPSVTVKAKGSDEFVRVTRTERVRPGATIRTGAKGRAQVDYGEGTYTRLNHDTTFVVVRLTDDTGERRVRTKVLSGETFNRVVRLSETESFTQSTKGAQAGVAGTTFVVNWSRARKTAVYTLVEGRLTLRARGQAKPLRLTSGQQVEVVDGAPGLIDTLTPEQLCEDPWICDNVRVPRFAPVRHQTQADGPRSRVGPI